MRDAYRLVACMSVNGVTHVLVCVGVAKSIFMCAGQVR